MLAEASLDTQKVDIIQWVSQIQDKSVIDDLQAYQQFYRQSMNNPMSEAEETAISKGFDDLENGRMRPHADALAIYGKWLNHG